MVLVAKTTLAKLWAQMDMVSKAGKKNTCIKKLPANAKVAFLRLRLRLCFFFVWQFCAIFHVLSLYVYAGHMYIHILPFVFARSSGNIPPQITCVVFPLRFFFTALPAFCGQRSRRRQSSIPVLFRRSCVSVCVCDGAWVVYVSCKQNAKEYAEKQNKYNAAKSELERQQQQRPILNF